MSLIKIEKAGLSYGLQVLLDGVDLTIERGQRLCLIGRNGTGKSSLLKVLDGEVDLDRGEVIRQTGIRIARLEQDLPEADDRLVFDAVAAGAKGVGELLAEYRSLSHAHEISDSQLARMAALQHEIEANDGWALQQKVDEIISRLDLPAERYMRELSGGWRRRVALASLRTTWTSPRSNGWKNSYSITMARWCLSPMTVLYCKHWRHISLSWTVDTCVTGRAITPAFWSTASKHWPMRPVTTNYLISVWRRKKSGFAKVLKRVAPAMRVACVP